VSWASEGAGRQFTGRFGTEEGNWNRFKQAQVELFPCEKTI